MQAGYLPEIREPREFNQGKRKFHGVYVVGDEYRECERCSEHHSSRDDIGIRSRDDPWKPGLINTKDDPYKNVRIGNLGEMAFAKISGLPCMIGYARGKNKPDFTLPCGATVDVKTNARRSYDDTVWVKSHEFDGFKIKKFWDLYVFAYAKFEFRSTAESDVHFIGWQTREFIMGSRQGPALSGSHWNYYVNYTDLLSIDSLKPLFRHSG